MESRNQTVRFNSMPDSFVRQRSGAAMHARTSTTLCSAAMLAAAAFAGEADETKTIPSRAINYSLADTGMPAPSFLKSVKPTVKNPEQAKADKLVAAGPVKAETLKAPTTPTKLEPPLPVLPLEPTPPKFAKVEPAVVMPNVAMATAPASMSGTYLPSVDDHMKCIDCLKTLSGSPIESDRKAALADLGK